MSLMEKSNSGYNGNEYLSFMVKGLPLSGKEIINQIDSFIQKMVEQIQSVFKFEEIQKKTISVIKNVSPQTIIIVSIIKILDSCPRESSSCGMGTKQISIDVYFYVQENEYVVELDAWDINLFLGETRDQYWKDIKINSFREEILPKLLFGTISLSFEVPDQFQIHEYFNLGSLQNTIKAP